MNRGGRPRGSAAPYRLERACVVERAFKVLRAAGLERDQCKIEIAAAAGFSVKGRGYVDQVRRECPARYRCERPTRVLHRADIEAYLGKLRGTFRAIDANTNHKRLLSRWQADRKSAAKYRAVANCLSREAK